MHKKLDQYAGSRGIMHRFFFLQTKMIWKLQVSLTGDFNVGTDCPHSSLALRQDSQGRFDFPVGLVTTLAFENPQTSLNAQIPGSVQVRICKLTILYFFVWEFISQKIINDSLILCHFCFKSRELGIFWKFSEWMTD